MVLTTLLAPSIRDVAPEERATAMGVFQAIFATGMLAGPLVSGVLADSLSLASVFYVSAALSGRWGNVLPPNSPRALGSTQACARFLKS